MKPITAQKKFYKALMKKYGEETIVKTDGEPDLVLRGIIDEKVCMMHDREGTPTISLDCDLAFGCGEVFDRDGFGLHWEFPEYEGIHIEALNSTEVGFYKS